MGQATREETLESNALATVNHMPASTITLEHFQDLLRRETTDAFPWERKPPELTGRALRQPETNLGEGRARFWRLLERTADSIANGQSICDFGAYPGTYLRLVRAVGGQDCRLTAAGFGFSDEFRRGMETIRTNILELEFDVRYPRHSGMQHILSYPLTSPESLYDVAVCTEVIEHQMYPLSLLAGMNRFLKLHGHLYLTTNSVSFIGDILKLSVGRHNVESLERSHVLDDCLWRPHIRLYTLRELRELLRLTGFAVREGFYYDNGSVYRGWKGLGVALIRSTAGVLPHLRSHIFVVAEKIGEPTAEARKILDQTLANYNLGNAIYGPANSTAVA